MDNLKEVVAHPLSCGIFQEVLGTEISITIRYRCVTLYVHKAQYEKKSALNITGYRIFGICVKSAEIFAGMWVIGGGSTISSRLKFSKISVKNLANFLKNYIFINAIYSKSHFTLYLEQG